MTEKVKQVLTVPAVAGPSVGDDGLVVQSGAQSGGYGGALASIDRSNGGARGGSIALVLGVAVLLVAAATGIVLAGRSNAEPYILAFLAALATIGVFSL